MRKIIEYIVRYPIWANAIVVLFVLFGTLSYIFKLKKSFFPEIDPRNITISVVLPGASPEEMEEGVTIKLEEALKSIEGIDEITSTSSENVASVNIVTFKNADIDEVATEVKNAVDRINSFPVNAERPLIFKGKPRSRTVFLGLKIKKGSSANLFDLKRQAEKIEDDLLATGDISQISIFGYPSIEISIEVPEANLSRYGLTFDQVAAAVRLNNRDISAGSIKAKEEEILIRSRAKSTDADRIGNIVLKAGTDGSNILLKDIGTVKEQFSDTPNESYMNGERSVTIQVDKLPEEDLEKITIACEKYVEEFNSKNNDVELSITFKFLDLLKERLVMLQSNGAMGLVLVLICLGLFLSLRLSFWVAWGIPSAFFGMFMIGAWIGITINMISLFGMILVVGILVDDGIVIAENVYTHFERGKSPIQAAVDGTVEVLPAVFTSVFSTMLAFVPLLVLEGFEFLVEMAIVVIVSLGVSMLEAFFVLPAHISSPSVLSRHKKVSDKKGMREYLNDAVDWVRFGFYSRILAHCLAYRYIYITVPFAFIMVILGAINGGFIKTTFFPSIPFDDFNVDIAFTAGTREEKIREYLKVFEKKIWEANAELKKETQDPKDFISYTFMQVGQTSDGLEQGSHAGHVRISLQDMDGRKITSFEVASRVREKIGKVPEAEKFLVAGMNRFGKPLSISLLSKDAKELELAKVELKKALANFPMLKDITDNVTLGRREMQLQLKPKAYFLGLTHEAITRQIRQGFFGEEIQRLQKGTDEVRVWVRYPEKDRFTVGQLENMKVKAPNGIEYPLTELADYKMERGIVNIKHYNSFREIVVEAELEDPNEPTVPIVDKIKSDIVPVLKAKYRSLNVEFGGQQRRTSKALASFTEVIIPVLFIMITLLALTFRSFSQAIMVFLMIPIGIFCAVVGHGIEGKPVSILSFWGMLALSGVIINDTVVLLEKFNQNLQNGMTLLEAAHNAGTSRFRAVILTSLTTVAGLYPLILEKSFQAQFLIPMAISMAYGIGIGTFFNLLIFPVGIVVANDMRRWSDYVFRFLKAFWSGNFKELKMPTREEVEPTIKEEHRLIENDRQMS